MKRLLKILVFFAVENLSWYTLVIILKGFKRLF